MAETRFLTDGGRDNVVFTISAFAGWRACLMILLQGFAVPIARGGETRTRVRRGDFSMAAKGLRYLGFAPLFLFTTGIPAGALPG